MKDKTKYINSFIIASVLIYAWIMLVYIHGDVLYAVQNFNPFLGTESYFSQCISHPGGLREWVGGWLTQLFFYPWLGATVQVFLWGIGVVALISAFHLKRSMQVLTLIPVVALLASMTQLGYWVFCLKTPSYWMGPTVGFTCVALGLWLYASLGDKCRLAMLAIWVLAGFPALGWYATLGLVIMLLMGPKVTQGFFHHWPKWLLAATALSTFALSVIALYYQNSPNIHWRDPLLLYGFHHVVIPEASSVLMEVPFHIMAVSMIILPIISHLRRFRLVANYGWYFSVPMLVAALYAGMMMNYRNENFHKEATLLRQLEKGGEWTSMLKTIGENKTKPTREMVMMKDVALAQLGQLGEYGFAYDVRATRPHMATGLPIHMVHSAGPYFYYWLGLPNYAYMWCMENSIEYGFSPYWLKLMYRSAKVNGEEEVAKKYKALLQNTLFYKDFDIDDKEILAVRRFLTDEDQNHLDNDGGFVEGFLMHLLSTSTYNNAEGQQIAMHYALLMKDVSAFMSALEHYRALVGEERPLPRFVQEAYDIFSAELSDEHQPMIIAGPYTPTYRWYYDNYNDFKTY